MPRVSVVVPAYCSERYLDECLLSIEGQTFENLEIIVVDDASSDATPEIIRSHARHDERILPVRLEKNSGTLGARKAGVLCSSGDYVMLVDQDDELEPQAVERLVTYADEHPSDIYHFSAKVIGENDAASDAREGMQTFLTPSVRRIEGDAILQAQLAESDGFDWHVHHKMFKGDFARACYALAADERLVLADDIYMSFIFSSMAAAYESVPNSAWYVYHLGRGETYGKSLDSASYERLVRADGRAFALAREYAYGPSAPQRDDWPNRLGDLRDRLVFHAMNEWMDNLPDELKESSLEVAFEHLPADAVCGELYRFVRDCAYALLQDEDRESGRAKQLEADTQFYLRLAQRAEHWPNFDGENGRYMSMKEIAQCHLRDCGLLPDNADACMWKRLVGKASGLLRGIRGW